MHHCWCKWPHVGSRRRRRWRRWELKGTALSLLTLGAPSVVPQMASSPKRSTCLVNLGSCKRVPATARGFRSEASASRDNSCAADRRAASGGIPPLVLANDDDDIGGKSPTPAAQFSLSFQRRGSHPPRTQTQGRRRRRRARALAVFPNTHPPTRLPLSPTGARRLEEP